MYDAYAPDDERDDEVVEEPSSSSLREDSSEAEGAPEIVLSSFTAWTSLSFHALATWGSSYVYKIHACMDQDSAARYCHL